MAGKFLPMAVLAGAAIYLVAGTEKKKKKKEDLPENIHSAGSFRDYGWRVRKEAGEAGFAPRYFGEIREPGTEIFFGVHEDGRADPGEAQALAMEAIAASLAATASEKPEEEG